LIDLDSSVHIEFIGLKTALPGEEVLDRSSIEDSKSREIRLLQFYESIDNSESFVKTDLDAIIDNIASNSNLSEDVRTEAIRRLGEAREKLSLGEDDDDIN